MKNQTDLLPWILGGLSVATVAVVIAVASTGKTVAPSLSPAAATTAQLTSAPTAGTVAAVPAVAVLPASVAVPEATPLAAAPVQAQDTAEPAVPNGQIWECVTNGIKTFSNNPCGEKSSLLQMRAINTMNPTPVVRYARTYGPEPRYSPGYADQNSYSDQDTYDEPGANTANSYTVVQGLAFLPRRRPDHPHHRPPFQHNPGDHPGRNSGAPPRRN